MTSPVISREGSTPSSVTDQISIEADEEIMTELTLAGVKVFMVRKRDQIIYKLANNMSVASIGEEQRQQLVSQIQTLHAAIMATAAKADKANGTPRTPAESLAKTIAPRQNGFAAAMPASASSAEADALKETARKLREELEQQQRQQMGAGAPEMRTTRKYVKTGKYSKKRLQQQQQQQQHQQQSGIHQQSQAVPPALSQQKLLELQQSLQMGSAAGPSSIPMLSPSKPFPFPPGQLPSQPILSKRLKEEDDQHLEVKRRFTEALGADQRAVTHPDYKTPFKSMQDAIDRLLPYHIYQYPKNDLDANKIPMERLDETMLELFKCQAELFKKHAEASRRIDKSLEKLSLQVLIERHLLAEQKQKLTEEQTRVAREQAAQQQHMFRIHAEQARLAPAGSLQSSAYMNGLAHATALLQNPQFANQSSNLSPELQQQLRMHREQLTALIEQHNKDNNKMPTTPNKT